MEETQILSDAVDSVARRGRKRGSAAVMLEGYMAEDEYTSSPCHDGSPLVCRSKSLTDEDLEDLRGCLDLGFGFTYDEIPDLCGTLPALELCYSMSQRLLDKQQQQQQRFAPGEKIPSGPISPVRVANWKISSPGDHPDEVKARLRYWAQAVACTLKLCR